MIVVFGSINVDLTFRVERQPAPGETVLSPSYLASPGGKGANQAAAAARAGAKTVMVGCIGRDGFAELAAATMRQSGVDTAPIKTVETPTGCATICVDDAGENAIVVASGANLNVRADQVPDSLLGPETLLLMQMEVPLAENWALLDRACARGVRTALNVAPAAPVPAAALDALDYLIVNEVEGAAIAQSSGLDPQPPEELARRLAARHNLNCVLTLGAAGAILRGSEGGFAIPALAVAPTDTTGAGDTFVGYLAAGIDAGLSTVEASCRASAAAAIACTKQGAQIGIPFAREVDSVSVDLAPAKKID